MFLSGIIFSSSLLLAQTAPIESYEACLRRDLETLASKKTTNRVARLMADGAHNNDAFALTGIIRDAYRDETDPEYALLILNTDDATIYVDLKDPNFGDRDRLQLVGARVSVLGTCDCGGGSNVRPHKGPTLFVCTRKNIRIVTPPPDNPFDAPDLKGLRYMPPDRIASFGRVATTGRVIARWGHSALLRASDGTTLTKVDFSGLATPRFGETIEAVGFPETDLYHINLVRSEWRPSPAPCATNDTAEAISWKSVMHVVRGHTYIDPGLHGTLVTVRGTVCGRTGESDGILIESDGYTIRIQSTRDPNILDRIPVGSAVSVTGTCIMDIDNWSSNNEFPQIRSYFIVPRMPDDIVVLKRPSWWTPVRFLTVTGILLALLVGILLWNASLRILAVRRSRELVRVRLHDIESELRTDERTKLAAELHDYLLQNLTAIGFHVDAARKTAAAGDAGCLDHLSTVGKILAASHTELRRCLWDLRSDVLSERDFEKAIRRCVDPVLETAAVRISFPVPRARLTDSTAHAILSVIRELVANATRHGKADAIAISGEMTQGVVRFTVEDNGCGFDPAKCPGLSSGHLGLEGIRERIRSLQGTFTLDSSPGHGTRAAVSLHTDSENAGRYGS